MENIFSEKVTKLNDNIDQMASQLSSLGKDIESRAMSLHNNIQVLLLLLVAIAVVASAIKNENMNDAILSFLACGKVMGLESDERAKNEYFSNG